MPTRKGSKDRREERAAKVAKPAKKAKHKPKPSAPSAPTAAEQKKATPLEPGKAPRRNPLFPVGVNYYPLDSEAQGAEKWYTGDIDTDFDVFAAARMSLVRVYVSWNLLEPQVGQYDEDVVERLQQLIEAAHTRKMQVIVCFFADDRVSELLDVPWGKKRDPRTDSYLIQREVALVQKIVNRFRSESGVFAWDLANEAFCSGFESAAELDEWVETLRDAVREVDPERPIIISVDPETLYRHTGVDPRRAIDRCEFAVSHATSGYRAYAAEGPLVSGPSTYLDSFLLRAAARDLPVLADDVGVLSLDNSAAEEAAHVRTALFSALINRGAGAILRRYRDLATEKREPYFCDPFELLVGVADADGEAKPTLAQVESFARVAARIDFRRYELLPERTAVLIPAERYEPLPNLASLYDPRACLTAYIAAKRAQVPVAIAREGDALEAYSLLVIPSVFELAEETWEQLAEYVQEGGTVLMSYGGGDAHSATREIFGVEFLGDGGSRDHVTCRIAQPDVLGPLVSFDVTIDTPNFALLGHGGATVVATDAKGSPLITMNQYGQGRAILYAFPVERAVAQGDPWATPEPLKHMMSTVIGSLAGAAGCGAPAECDAPDVEMALFNGEQDDILVLLNHSPEKLTASLTFERDIAAIADVRGGKPSAIGGPTFGVPLEASGVATLRLTY